MAPVTSPAVALALLLAGLAGCTLATSCDYSVGSWQQSPGYSTYTGFSCKYIESSRNCQANGRKDTGYLNWRWVPTGCPYVKFNAQGFLAKFRNKTVAFAGDSFLRNFYDAFHCLLNAASPAPEWKGIVGRSPLLEGFQVPAYSLRVVLVPSDFLVTASSTTAGSKSSSSTWVVDLDKVDSRWSSLVPNIDLLVLSHGAWFENAPVTKRIYRVNGVTVTRTPGDAITQSLSTVRTFLFSTKFRLNGRSFYLTASPNHYESAFVDGKSTCSSASNPFSAAQFQYVLQKSKAGKTRAAQLAALATAPWFKRIDVTKMAMWRPDAHVGVFGGGDRDCSHWCTPGLVDNFADIMYAQL